MLSHSNAAICRMFAWTLVWMVASTSNLAIAGEFNEKLSVGDAAPAWWSHCQYLVGAKIFRRQTQAFFE